MKEVGIFYGSSSGKTESVAMRIYERIGEDLSEIVDISISESLEIGRYRTLIFGLPTWGLGQLQDDWLEFLPVLKMMDLSGRRVALFGLGDQESYPNTFADAVGIIYRELLQTGCELVGKWPVLGYDFLESKAVQDGMFVGLIVDEENQPEMTDIRIDDWLQKILPGLNRNLNA